MPPIDLSQLDLTEVTRYLLYGLAGLGSFVAALWLAAVIWTFRDMRARSRDILAALLAALLVAVLNLPALLIYLILRPRETLAEQYERALQEEALLQQIETKLVCAGCNRPSQPDWQVCPHCMTILRKACAQCGRALDLNWNVCPYCLATAPGREMPIGTTASTEPTEQAKPAQPVETAPIWQGD
jgi:RNA polymerase subunit RPABC4/transcription elongation factor Spt4